VDAKYSNWKMEHLPIVPETWNMKPNAKTKKQLTVVKIFILIFNFLFLFLFLLFFTFCWHYILLTLFSHLLKSSMSLFSRFVGTVV
jgi:hypothetical protein